MMSVGTSSGVTSAGIVIVSARPGTSSKNSSLTSDNIMDVLPTSRSPTSRMRTDRPACLGPISEDIGVWKTAKNTQGEQNRLERVLWTYKIKILLNRSTAVSKHSGATFALIVLTWQTNRRYWRPLGALGSGSIERRQSKHDRSSVFFYLSWIITLKLKSRLGRGRTKK